MRNLGVAAILTLVMAGPAFSLPAVVPVSDEQIARFEGTWLGDDNPTPFGPISFAMDFQWEEDGSLHSHSAMSQETWVDLHFRKLEHGWVLDESASLAGMGVQEYRLHPVRAAGDTLDWAYLKSPWYLTVRTVVSADHLYMLVLLRDERHVEFHLPRVTGDMAAAVRAELEAGKTRAGQDDVALLKAAAAQSDGGGTDDDPVEVRNARARVLSTPDDAEAHLQLAQALAQAINSAPQAKVPGYAMEMLSSYQKAAQLDPTSVDAHFGLAQYYLNAPPIAGGSLESAGKEAAVLTELESPMGEIVLAQIEAKQGKTKAALARLEKLVEKHPDLDMAQRMRTRLAEAAQREAEAEQVAGSEK